MSGAWPQPLSRDEAIQRIAGGVLRGKAPRFVFPYGPDVVRKVGSLIDAGLDCLIFNMPLSQPDTVARAGKLLTSTFS